MSRLGLPLSRRAFIVAAAAAGGGPVVGLRLANRGAGGGFDQDTVEIHDWITVSPDSTTTIRIARMKMGQRTMTCALAQGWLLSGGNRASVPD